MLENCERQIRRKTWREAVTEKFELNIVVYTSPT